MAELTLEEAIPRFKANEDRVDRFVNGGDTSTWTTSGGTTVPSLLKFLKDWETSLQAAASDMPQGTVRGRAAGAGNGAPQALTAAQLSTILGLGNSATRNVGTSAGTVMAGNDSRVADAFPKTGGTLTGSTTITPPSGPAMVVLNKPVGTVNNDIVGQTNGVTRWTVSLGQQDEDFAISRYANNGAYLGSPLSINRLTGTGLWQGRMVFYRGSGSGTAPTPDIEQNVTEAFSAGSGFYIPNAILATKTGGSGHREALHIEQVSSASSQGEFIVALTGIAKITGASGSAFGLNGVGWVLAGAAASTEVSGGEFNTDVRATVARKTGIQIVDVAESSRSGTAIDAGIYMAKQPGGVGYSCGIQFGSGSDSLFPVFAGGKMISCIATPVTIAAGVDFVGLGATSIAAFVAAAGTNGLAFGRDFGGGLIRSNTASGGAIMTLGSEYVDVDKGIQVRGIRSRAGFNGYHTANWINFLWNGGTNKLDIFVDDSKIGSFP